MATNKRTTAKAAIRRASAAARKKMGRLDRAMEQDLTKIYKSAQADIAQTIRAYGDEDDNLRLTVMRDLLRQVNTRLGNKPEG